MSDRDKDEYKITVKKNKEGDGLTIIVGKDIARYIIEAAKIKHFSLSDTIRDATIGYYYRITDNVKKQYLSDNQKQFIRRLSDILINANCIIRLISKDHTIYPELIKAEAEKLNKIIKESECKMKDEYVPFGKEWEKEINKFPKKDIIKMLADALKELKTIEKVIEGSIK